MKLLEAGLLKLVAISQTKKNKKAKIFWEAAFQRPTYELN